MINVTTTGRWRYVLLFCYKLFLVIHGRGAYSQIAYGKLYGGPIFLLSNFGGFNGNRSRASYSFTYSVRKTCSSFSSRLMHGSFCSIFFTRAQSVQRRMPLGCHENINIQKCSPLPMLSMSGVRRVRGRSL